MNLRRNLYRGARILGDLESAKQGPAGVGKRIVRKKVYARTNSLTRQLLRAFGLSK